MGDLERITTERHLLKEQLAALLAAVEEHERELAGHMRAIGGQQLDGDERLYAVARRIGESRSGE